MLRTRRASGSVVARYGIGAIYAARDFALAARSFVTDDTYRSTTLLRWFKSAGVHQTTVVTWMDRYPTIFSACRDFFAGVPDIRILSFGCSSGEEVLTLRQYFPTAYITGAEINPRNLTRCRQLKVDDRIAFVHSERAAIERLGPFDLIFCMAVLQRTPHKVQSEGITSLKEIYPFEKFDRQISELDAFLKKDGLMVIHHTQYLFTDSSVATKYDVLDWIDGLGAEQGSDGPKFDRNSALIGNAARDKSIYRKTAS
ncbi:MAG: methyltransferase domain-containing protein [Gemmatimonadaceae bacterium]